MTLEQADKLALAKSKQGKELGELTSIGLGHVRSILKQVFEEHEKQLQEFVDTKTEGYKFMNGYIAFYDGKEEEVFADTSFDAQKKAVYIFQKQTRKKVNSYDIIVVLCEKNGEQVIRETNELN